MSEPLTDTPTHRYTILQVGLDQLKKDLDAIRLRRAHVQAKITRAKQNSKVERALSLDGQLKRLMSRLNRQLLALDEDMETIEDNINKARGLILEASDGELALTKSGPEHNEKDS